MLADLGAEVIKIEKFPGGDDASAFNSSGGQREMPASFQIINRGKKSVALDIRTPQGRDVLLKLVESADVVTRSEEHTSELQSLMRISYAVFCLKKNKIQKNNTT